MSSLNSIFRTMVLGACLGGALSAQTNVVNVNTDITTSTTWTSNNQYNLQKQIYVRNGATLTIEGGTVIGSQTGLGGSLAVARGSRIYVQGTSVAPVIMTSQADINTWVNGNPKTAKWREACNEWGNLTLMGNAYISEDATKGNTPAPNANNVAAMEGLVAQSVNDPNVLYGGGNDNDNSGTISYLSLRYGGKVIGLNNELNGLSLGGIGRGTDIHHIEIMNNVDDGTEIWGGTVNLKYFSIWNIGDDSFDIDQGWRGKAQFIFIVQGYSVDASQGSGVGDNCFETDGAEQSDYQPVTTGVIYNATVVGQPYDGDQGTAWRDNCRMQYHNCIFMDIGDQVVGFDNVDGDGGKGYGFNGTLSWAQCWTTSYKVTSTVNAPSNPAAFYKSQTSGNLCEITDTVFFRNTGTNAYTEANARNVFATANNNVMATNMPIQQLIRAAPVVKGGKAMAQVTYIDPSPANDALTSVGWAPNDGFFSSAHYRGAFAPGNNWLTGWTAAYAFGFLPQQAFCDEGLALAGKYGDPVLTGSGTLLAGKPVSFALSNANEKATFWFGFGVKRADFPFAGGTLVPDINLGGLLMGATDGSGAVPLAANMPKNVPSGITIYTQYWIADPKTPYGLSASNAVSLITP
jgi:hypothetical protein